MQNILKKAQLLFYVLSSMQATAIPILINMSLPMHLYSSLQIMASCVFRYVPPWNEGNEKFQQPAILYGLRINTEAEFLYPDQEPPYMFQRVQFSSNFILNASHSLLTITLVWVLYYAVRMVYKRLKFVEGRKTAAQFKYRFYFVLANNFVLKTHEAVFLNLSLSIFLQCENFNFQSTFNIVSLLMAISTLLYLICFFHRIHKKVNHRKFLNDERISQFIDKYSPFIEDIQFQAVQNQQPVSQCAFKFKCGCGCLSFSNKMKSYMRKNYHLIGFIKKTLVTILLVFLQGSVVALLIAMTAIHFAMLMLTCALLPYQQRSLNVIKVAGDFCLFAMFGLLIVVNGFY